jgi:hypothetical protein
MKYIISITIIFFSPTALLSQKIDSAYTKPDTLLASKKKCKCEKVGFKISISESKQNSSIINRCDYVYQNLYEADKKLKIKLITTLLNFKMDKSISCTNVKCYRTIALKYKDSVESKNYNLNISALYHINFICFGTFATYYAPFPVLYNKRNKKEINDNDIEIYKVFDIYKNWFEECKENNFSKYIFPLQNSEYCWKYGSSKEKYFYDLPIIKSDLKESIGKPRN